MHGTEYQRRRRTVPDKFIDEDRGNLARISLIRESHLPRECVSVKPVEQLFAVRRDRVNLRIVHVAVYEPRHDQLAGVVLDTDIA